MSDIKITTNHVPRSIIDASQLTDIERADFDYLDWDSIEAGSDSASFIRYRGELVDLGEMMHVADDLAPGWDGYRSDSFFSGLVVRYIFDDNHGHGEMVIVGRYLA